MNEYEQKAQKASDETKALAQAIAQALNPAGDYWTVKPVWPNTDEPHNQRWKQRRADSVRYENKRRADFEALYQAFHGTPYTPKPDHNGRTDNIPQKFSVYDRSTTGSYGDIQILGDGATIKLTVPSGIALEIAALWLNHVNRNTQAKG